MFKSWGVAIFAAFCVLAAEAIVRGRAMKYRYELIKASAVKAMFRRLRPGVRVSHDVLLALDGMVRNKIEWTATLPMNKKTVKDIL